MNDNTVSFNVPNREIIFILLCFNQNFIDISSPLEMNDVQNINLQLFSYIHNYLRNSIDNNYDIRLQTNFKTFDF